MPSESDSSTSVEDEDEEEKSTAIDGAPDAWGCVIEDAGVGTFAMLEVVYQNGDKGISLVQVLGEACSVV